jgi:benzodiazapine receptor
MKLRQILNWIGLLVVITVNTLANVLPLNGQTTGDISNGIPVLFTPAGYVFLVWNIIYLGLLGFAFYQGRRAQASADFQDRIGYWFAASCLFNAAWIFAWHYEQFPLSLVLMLGLLASLLAIYLRLGIGRRMVSAEERRWVHLPFSIYLGWISVATVANVSVVLYKLGWNGQPLGPEVWTMLVMLVAAGLGIAMILLRKEIAYPLVIIWALVGIAVARAAMPAIAITAVIAALLVAAVLVAARLRRAPEPSTAG